MTDQQPVEPDAIVDRDGAAVPYRRAEDNAASLASHTLMPMLARMTIAGPVLRAAPDRAPATRRVVAEITRALHTGG